MLKNVWLLLALLMGTAVLCSDVSAQEAVESQFGIKIYGKLKLDMSYDDSRVNTGDFANYVMSEASNKDDSEFNMTASETRLGLNFSGPDYEDLETSGQLEIDFFDISLAENKARPYLRHAFVKVNFPEEDMDIIAGQTWDVIAPLTPTTLNYAVMYCQGNIAMRHPQLRLTKRAAIDDKTKLALQLALTRTIGDAATYSPGDTGEDADFPTLQARLALSLPLLTAAPSTIGIFGHYGTEEYDLTADGKTSKDYTSSSAGVDLTLPITAKIGLKGEFWQGKNMDDYLGGISQGVNTTLQQAIAGQGGWICLSFGPFTDWRFNLGAGIDDPDDDDLSAGNRTKNRILYGNVLYNLTEAVQVGLELSSLETEYKGQETADAMRVQAAMSYTF